LCYPDESSSLSLDCLKNFQGTFIIHVGELIHTGTVTASIQSPWGRTTSSDFQVNLSSKFHCLLQARIPSFPFSNDYITVWKRTRVVEADGTECSNARAAKIFEDAENGEEEEEESWKDIPAEERLPDVCAPCLKHLMPEPE